MAKSSTAQTEVTVEQRKGDDRRQKNEPVKSERRKVQRRRQIDPTTCERDYSDDEIEFMTAMDQYKRDAGRMFPTCSEILEVLGNLGYVKLSAEEQAARQVPTPTNSESEDAALESDESIEAEFAEV